eukprot:12241766-Heterocapsa_arctica.AAC.1
MSGARGAMAAWWPGAAAALCNFARCERGWRVTGISVGVLVGGSGADACASVGGEEAGGGFSLVAVNRVLLPASFQCGAPDLFSDALGC